MSEESRAIEFRRTMTARSNYRCEQRYRGLPGDTAARAAVFASWDPWVNPVFDWDVNDCEGDPAYKMTPLGPVALKAGRQLA